MIGPEVEAWMIVPKLVVHLIASLHSLISPLLTVVDSIRAIVSYGTRTLADAGSLTDAGSPRWAVRR